jgi:hypothetical protein
LVNQIGLEGTTASVRAKLPDVLTGQLQEQEIWRGFFEEVVDERSTGVMRRDITAYDIGKYLATDEEDYVMQNTSLSGMLHRIATDFSIPVGTIPDTATNLGNIVGRGEKLWDIIQKGVQRHKDLTGVVWRPFFRDGRLQLMQQGTAEKWWVFEVGRSLERVRRTRTIADLENRVKVYGQVEDELAKSKVEATAENADSQRIYGLRQRVEYVATPEDRKRVLDVANERVKRNAIPDVTIEIHGPAIPMLRAGETIEAVDAEMGLSGMFFAESLECSWTSSKATTIGTCRRAPIDPGLWMEELVVA